MFPYGDCGSSNNKRYRTSLNKKGLLHGGLPFLRFNFKELLAAARFQATQFLCGIAHAFLRRCN